MYVMSRKWVGLVFVASISPLGLGMGCSSSSNNGGTDGGAEGGRKDGSPAADSSPTKDHESADAPHPSDTGISCETSTASYTPAPYSPATAHQGVCTSVDIAAFVTACGDGSTQATCKAWAGSNVATKDDASAGNPCGNCIISQDNNGVFWFDPDGDTETDLAACVQLTDTTNGIACATAIDALLGCDAVGCDSCTSSATEQNDCVMAVQKGSCSTYASGLTSACPTLFDPGGAYATCTPGLSSGMNQTLTYIANLLCGGSDGGTDAGGSG
jgi:hypothetical protein